MSELENRYHWYLSLAEADQTTPHFEWAAFFKVQDNGVGRRFSPSPPKFFASDRMIARTPAADWQVYHPFLLAPSTSP